MAAPYDEAWDLEDVSEIIHQQYFTNYEQEWSDWFGKNTNQLIRPHTETIMGDGKTMNFELAPGDTVRFATTMLGAFADPDTFDPGVIKVRFNKQTSANDFVRVSGSCQTNDIDLEAGKNGSIVDFVERMQAQIEPAYDEGMAIHRNIGRSARLALVNGTPTLNNGTAIDATAGVASSSTATNTGGARFKIDNGSIAYFRAGRRIDICNATTGVAYAANVRVTDVNVVDSSIGVAFGTTGSHATRLSTGNLASVVDNAEIFMSGERNAGMYSLGAYFTAPTAGESFIGGVDRTTSDYRFMNPLHVNYSASPTPLTKSVVDTLSKAMQYRSESEIAVVLTTDLDLHQKLRNEYTEAAFLNIPDGDNRLKRFANFGALGLNYQHPAFGLLKIVADVLQTSGTLRAVIPANWRALQYGRKGLRMMPGQGGGRNGWYRVTESAPNTGNSMIWKCDFYALHCDWCFAPWKQGHVTGLTV